MGRAAGTAELWVQPVGLRISASRHSFPPYLELQAAPLLILVRIITSITIVITVYHGLVLQRICSFISGRDTHSLARACRYTSCLSAVFQSNSQVPGTQASGGDLLVNKTKRRLITPRITLTNDRYEFYYDVVQGGQYTFEIGRMHEKYGPIIRINPYELHVSSPDFYEKLYAGPGNRRHRWDWFTAQFGLPESMFGTNDHDSHRIRRAAVNPFFSKGAVRKLQPIIDERIDALLNRFQEFQTSSQPIILNYAFSAYTNGKYCTSFAASTPLTGIIDIAQEYAFARSDHRVDQHDFEPTFHNASIAGSSNGALVKQYPWVLPLMQSLPESFMAWLNPDMTSYFGLQNVGYFLSSDVIH